MKFLKSVALLSLIFFCLTVQAQVNLNLGLVAYYPFNGNANDASGNNRNGTLVNGTAFGADRFGAAGSSASFDGIDDYIKVPDNGGAFSSPVFSVVAWFYSESPNLQCLIGKRDYATAAGTGGAQYQMFINYSLYPGLGSNLVGNNSTCNSIPFSSYINTQDELCNNRWNCIIVTFDGSRHRLYLNGVLKRDDPTAFSAFLNCSSELRFGNWWQLDPQSFKGRMDDIRWYNRVLTQDEITLLGENNSACNTLTCSNWLNTPSLPSYITAGDIDVAGNQLTVEALFNRTAPLNNNLYYGNLVSKHTNQGNVNYSLLPNGCEITTAGTGYTTTFETCPAELNKNYHVAMVYDGTALKFYRNGFLMSQQPCTGNLITNDLATTIGQISSSGAPLNNQFLGYINEVRIWNVARTQADIRNDMNKGLTNPATTPGLVAYYQFNDLQNKQGNSAFNGTASGNAQVNSLNTKCEFVADSCRAPAQCSSKSDFAFNQDACNPLNAYFQTNATGFNSIKWDFGDGNNITALTSLYHLYSTYNTYTVKMILDNGSCLDTVTKTITLDLQNDNQLIQTNDTTICIGNTKQLLATPSNNFCWSPTTYLDNPNISNPTTSTPQNITYYYTAETTGTNLITNGSFSSGNSGFTSQYNFANPNTTEGQYFTGTSPAAWNASMSACVDHTTGSGNMMMVNGSPAANVEVWRQTITVTPNTNYTFSTWIQALWPPNPAQLQFSINGNTVGSVITASLPTCTWTQFHTNWNSGNAVTAIISIVNKNTFVQGNDFALDDIFFSAVKMKRDSVKITVTSLPVKANNDTTFCKGGQVQLIATGATAYSWSPATGLSNSNIANPVATPSSTTQYIVTGSNAAGCSAKDTVLVTIINGPSVTRSNDTTICSGSSAQLFAAGGITYSWTPGATLSNTNIPNPVASPGITTTYFVTVTGGNTCTTLDSVRVAVRSQNNFQINPPVSGCQNTPVQLNASGGDLYNWSPAGSLTNSLIPNPLALPAATTVYTVLITDTVCHFTAPLTTTVTVLPLPAITANKTNDIDCIFDKSKLIAAGALTYNWSPFTGLTNPGTGTTVAIPSATTTYIVTGSDINGCMNKDSVTIYVTKNGKSGYFMPTAFTPNNDGLNDCYGMNYWGTVTELEFGIYNRWGERVFFTKNPGECWDGTYKGVPQPPGIFVFQVKAKTTCESPVYRKGTFALIR